ncbi:DNRLRE domain-containing protein [Clostridium sp.]|uniref:DNRLRE domain-containing protein n=2 Tax=Clostridium sp. TaxID=1506 RepID=UPI0025C09FB8|nr:DNRLRE domain-containing protein [Clostridium sp.]MCI1716871.1 DNRLRE domain-containing protein [Clostridium sp.]MCI1801199.1 DNRLRE domain-containing protein [Clostridium sp.]MCI1815057.1 DNRLRE domain-containing protein [Clostridium sp.]MCI2202665.1 DNRLRE domain-containing protein [Clostridium sp.]
MYSFMIPASNSLTVTDKISNGNIHSYKLTVGCDGQFEYYSLLYFNIASLPNNITVDKAELVLFKCDGFHNNKNVEFTISPIYDYFSIYTTYSRIPSFNNFSQAKFCPMTSKAAIVIDITHIVSSWIENISSNKGIIIYNIWNNCMASFGSELAKEQQMVPFITIKAKHKKCTLPPENKKSHCDYNFHLALQIINNCNTGTSPIPPDSSLVEVTVTGTVASQSTFVAMIEVIVTRSSGTIDKYYVSDEYVNPSREPLNINKTYSIPVVPPLAPGDTVTRANVYGSYKDS